MTTVGVFSAIIATWQATATNFQTMFGMMPESLGMVLWGVSLLALAGAVRHRSTKHVRAEHETASARGTRCARPAGAIESAAARFIDRHTRESECAVVR